MRMDDRFFMEEEKEKKAIRYSNQRILWDFESISFHTALEEKMENNHLNVSVY